MKRSDISGTDALSWMQVLNYSRPAGTAAEKQAAEQIAASIRPFADFVSVESFAWRPRKGDGNNEVLPSQNVCAFLAGTKDTPEYLVLSAHYDSVPEGPGAYDNLSSCAVMAELLRYFSCHRPKRSLTFVFLGAEELGLLGSRAYVERHQNELKNCRFNLNSDLAGQEGGIDVLGVTAGDEAVDTLRGICKEHGLSLVSPANTNGRSGRVIPIPLQWQAFPLSLMIGTATGCTQKRTHWIGSPPLHWRMCVRLSVQSQRISPAEIFFQFPAQYRKHFRKNCTAISQPGIRITFT